MSAFDRLPSDYRNLCERIAMRHALSPQNRNVRFAADLSFASRKTFPNRYTRQQDRAYAQPWKKRAAK